MINELTEQEIEELLYENVWGHLGCNDSHNNYVYPSNYIYDGKHIICHSQQGSKIHAMRENKRVCFQVDKVKDHNNWKSVMVHGAYEEINNEGEYTDSVKAFADRQMFLKISDNEQGLNPNNHKAIIYRIVIDDKKGFYEMD